MPSTDAARIQEMVRGLEQTERYMVLLFFVDQLTPREIALVLDQSLPEVEGAIEAFRQHAKQALEPQTAAGASATKPYFA